MYRHKMTYDILCRLLNMCIRLILFLFKLKVINPNIKHTSQVNTEGFIAKTLHKVS